MDIDSSFLQWVYVAIIAPVLGWIGGWFHSWGLKRRKTKTLISRLTGLPPEAKAILVDFHHQGTHTLRGDPGSPVVRLLIFQGFLSVGPGGGTYDAVDRYLTVNSDVWEAMENWFVSDVGLAPILEKFLQETEHDSDSNL